MSIYIDEFDKRPADRYRVPEEVRTSILERIVPVWQAAYFVHLCSQIESNGHSFSLGRLDQYLYPLSCPTGCSRRSRTCA